MHLVWQSCKHTGISDLWHGQIRRERRELSAKDKEWRRGNQMWLTAAGLAITAYFLLSGQYIQFSTDVNFDEDDIIDEE